MRLCNIIMIPPTKRGGFTMSAISRSGQIIEQGIMLLDK